MTRLVWRGPDGRTVPIELCPSPRARRLTLRADPAKGAIRVSLHPRASPQRALAFVAEQHAWIAKRVAAWPVPRPFTPDATIPLEGVETVIDWAPLHPRVPQLADARLRVGGPLESLAGRVERFLKMRARALLEAETQALASRHGLAVSRVAVRDPAARWGSCNSRGAIAYSWRLILAPRHVRLSVVAHEVAHLRYMHHGPEFWGFAAQLYGGDIEPARRWLRQHGAALHWVGRAAPA